MRGWKNSNLQGVFLGLIFLVFGFMNMIRLNIGQSAMIFFLILLSCCLVLFILFSIMIVSKIRYYIVYIMNQKNKMNALRHDLGVLIVEILAAIFFILVVVCTYLEYHTK